MGNGASENTDRLTFARECLSALRHNTAITLETSESSTLFTADPETIVSLLRKSLTEEKINASALDPSGRKSAAEMEDEIAKVAEDRYLIEARRYFNALRQGRAVMIHGDPAGTWVTDDPERIIPATRRFLTLAHKDASALDPTGRKSADEMEKEIRDGLEPQKNLAESDKQKYIADARSAFDGLHYGIINPDDDLRRIRGDLKKAGADASALDPEHKRSAEQMEAALQNAYRQGNLERARSDAAYINILQKGFDGDVRDSAGALAALTARQREEIESSVRRMNDEFRKAGVDTEALKGDVHPQNGLSAGPSVNQAFRLSKTTVGRE